MCGYTLVWYVNDDWASCKIYYRLCRLGGNVIIILFIALKGILPPSQIKCPYNTPFVTYLKVAGGSVIIGAKRQCSFPGDYR